MTAPAPRRSPLAELISFLASALAGLGVLRRGADPLPEVPEVNGGDPGVAKPTPALRGDQKPVEQKDKT